jgi:succinate dehydrogenase/fumarate reductase flavoprotein subunit
MLMLCCMYKKIVIGGGGVGLMACCWKREKRYEWTLSEYLYRNTGMSSGLAFI